MKLFVVVSLILTVKLINSTQVNVDVYCPADYKLIPDTKLCILITQNTTPHSNLCLSTGSTSTFYYLELILQRDVKAVIDFLRANSVKKFWLPIAMDERNVLVWKLPIPLWNRDVVEINDATAPTNYMDGRCAMFEANKKNWFMSDCRNEYAHVCFYDTIEPIVVPHTGFCANKLMGRSPKYHGTCFHIERIGNASEIMEWTSTVVVDTSEKLSVITEIIDKLGMSNTKILVSTNYKNVPSVIQHGVVVPWNFDDVQYHVVEDNLSNVPINKKPSIEISYQSDSDAVTVIIKNFEYLWNPRDNDVPLTCHYDINFVGPAVPFDFKRINISDSVRQMFVLTLSHLQGVGNLWCEGQMLFTFETVTSNRLVLNRNIKSSTKILSVSIESVCCRTYSNIYNELDRMRPFTNHLKQEVDGLDDFDVIDVQLKKIILVDRNRTKYLFHIIIETHLNEYVAKYFSKELVELNLTGYRVAEVRLNDECSSSFPDFFDNAKINEKSVIKKMCILDTGLPPTQECLGNIIDGPNWRQEYDVNELIAEKCNSHLSNERTEEMFKLNELLRKLGHKNGTGDKKETRAIVDKTLTLVNGTFAKKHDQVTDMRYATETLHNLLITIPADMFDEVSHGNVSQTATILEPISEIIDSILSHETNSVIVNENSKILETIDVMAERIANINISKSNSATNNTTNIGDNNNLADNDDGVILIRQKNFIVMIVNPLIKNITGIALYKIDKYAEEKSFHDFNVRKLRSDDPMHSIYNESLEITAHIPAESFDQIKINRNGELMPPDRIIFKIYYKNSLFNENITDFNETNEGKTELIESDSKVIGITIPNYHENELPPGIFTMFKTKQIPQNDTKLVGNQRGCSDNSRSGETRGWDRKLWNFENMSDTVVLCPVKRLANIGFVKLFGNAIVTDEMSIILINVLHYTTVVGCTASLVGLMLVFVTALIYEEWREREATPLVLNVSTASFLQLTMFMIAESGVFNHVVGCLIIGGILHYVTLAGFFISLFVTNCQYRRYIIVFGSAKTKYFKTKILIIGWIAPLLIVTACLVWTPNSYIQSSEHYELGGICYPSELILYLFVHGPIIIIFCINVCVYIWIVVQMTYENPSLRKTPKKTRVVMQIRLFFFIFFMLSLTWAFGLLAHYLESMTFAYLFNVTGPLQGFCLFVFCVVVDDKTRTFWIKFLFFRTKD